VVSAANTHPKPVPEEEDGPLVGTIFNSNAFPAEKAEVFTVSLAVGVVPEVVQVIAVSAPAF